MRQFSNPTTLEDREYILHAYLDALAHVSRRLREFGEVTDVEVKHDESIDYTSPLTKADQFSSETIHRELKAALSGIATITEEDVDEFGAEGFQPRIYNLADPIDGTIHFLENNGRPVILLALIEDGKPVVGVIQRIFEDEGYYAAKGLGSYKFKNGLENSERIHVNKFNPDEGIRVIHQGQYTPDEDTFNHFKNIKVKNKTEIELLRYQHNITESKRKKAGQEYPSAGGYEVGAFMEGAIAEGKYDFLLNQNPGTGAWDAAAPQIIIEEAGGHLTNIDGTPLDYTQPGKVGQYVVYNDVRILEEFQKNYPKDQIDLGPRTAYKNTI